MLTPERATVFTALIAASSVATNLWGGLLTERKKADLAKEVGSSIPACNCMAATEGRVSTWEVAPFNSVVLSFTSVSLDCPHDYSPRHVAIPSPHRLNASGHSCQAKQKFAPSWLVTGDRAMHVHA